jgi:hypothetical protein
MLPVEAKTKRGELQHTHAVVWVSTAVAQRSIMLRLARTGVGVGGRGDGEAVCTLGEG